MCVYEADTRLHRQLLHRVCAAAHGAWQLPLCSRVVAKQQKATRPNLHPKLATQVNFLMKRDAGKGRIDFVDIADPGYTAEANYGIDYQRVGLYD